MFINPFSFKTSSPFKTISLSVFASDKKLE